MQTNRIVTGNLICGGELKVTYVFLKVGTVYAYLDELHSIRDLIN